MRSLIRLQIKYSNEKITPFAVILNEKSGITPGCPGNCHALVHVGDQFPNSKVFVRHLASSVCVSEQVSVW